MRLCVSARNLVAVVAILVAMTLGACGATPPRPRLIRVLPVPKTLAYRPAPAVADDGPAPLAKREPVIARATPVAAEKELFVKSGTVMREVRISVGQPVGDFGSMTHDDVIARVMDGVFGLVRAYAQELLTDNPELHGTITLEFVTGDVRVVATTMGDAVFEATVAKQVELLLGAEDASGGIAVTFESRAFGDPWAARHAD